MTDSNYTYNLTITNAQAHGRFMEPEPLTRTELTVIWMIENWREFIMIGILLTLVFS